MKKKIQKDKKNTKIIGILGGMGPFATIDIYKEILDSVEVKTEREYPHVVINSNPKIPSRTRSFLFNEKSPVEGMIKEAKSLEKIGVDFIIIPCNSAHYFLQEVRKSIETEIVDMVEVVADYIHKKFPTIKKAGLLGGEVILGSDIYERSLCKYGITIIKPSEDKNNLVRSCIDMIKHNSITTSVKLEFVNLINSLIDEGSEIIILGCTEFPILFRNFAFKVPFIDTTKVLARYAAKKAGCKLRGQDEK